MINPIDFRTRIDKWTDGFIGRGWLFAEVDKFLKSSAGVMVITGEPGIGKTAFTAQMVRERKFLHHFINAQILEWVSPSLMINSLAAQIAAKYGRNLLDGGSVLPALNVNMEVGGVSSGAIVTGVHIDEFIASPSEDEFLRLVIDPLKQVIKQNIEPILILDGLEDADSFSRKPTITDLILSSGTEFPGKLIITSTQDRAVDMIVRTFPEEQIHRVDIQGDMILNMADCRDFVISNSAGTHLSSVLEDIRSPTGNPVDVICDRAEGNFLYLRTFLDELKQGRLEKLDLELFPQGLHRIYLAQLTRLCKGDFNNWLDVYAPIFGVLSVARAPLTIEQLTDFCRLSRGQVQGAVKELSRYLDFNPEVSFSDRGFSLYHSAMGSFILNPNLSEEFFISAEEQHRKIADSIHINVTNLVDLVDEYAVNNLSYHNRLAGADCYPRLFGMIDPDIQRQRRLKFKSDQVFRQDIAEAILATINIGPPEGIPELVRCGLIDASIISKVANVPTDILRELAQSGEWKRAISLAHTGTGRTSEGLAAIVSGILDSELEARIDLSVQICQQIDGFGEDAIFAARSHAEVAKALAEGGDAKAKEWLESASSFIDGIPEIDEQARVLALIGRCWFLIDKSVGIEKFDRALLSVRGMATELDSNIKDITVSNNMVAQSAMQSEWSASQTPFDTIGAKARVLADIAVLMAVAGDERANAILREAEEVAALIGSSGIEGLFSQHTAEYIEDRRKIVNGGALQEHPKKIRPKEELESQIEKAEKLARDQKGYYPRALISIAKAVIPINWKQAGEIMTRAEQTADRAEGGYRAQLLLELAKLRRQMGQTQAAEGLEQRAVQAAKNQPDLLAGYRDWLAMKGMQVALSLRQVASARHGLVKREFHSDQALANLALGLASQSPSDARVLVETIQDRSQRFRAQAGIAGHLEKLEAEKLINEIVENCIKAEDDFILLECSDAIVDNYPDLGKVLADQIIDPAKRILAWMGLVDALEGIEQKELLEEAYSLGKSVVQKSAILADGIARLGAIFLSEGDHRAEECFKHAITAARGESSLFKRGEVLCKIAASIGTNDPTQAKILLEDCADLSRRISGIRARGRILGKCTAVAMNLDPEMACRLLAESRYLGRANFLDAVAHIIEPIVERYGATYAWKIYQVLIDAERF